MLFFRSEELARVWCEERDYPLRPVVSMSQLWKLSTAWYTTRLDPESQKPRPDEMRSIFSSIGLTGDFWDPTAATFGARGAA